MTYTEFLEQLTSYIVDEITWRKHGNRYKRTTYNVLGIHLELTEVIPWNIYLEIYEYCRVDYVLPMNTKLPEDMYMDPNYYTEEGFGYPMTRSKHQLFASVRIAFNYITQHLKQEKEL